MVTERSDPAMAWLGVVFALLVLAQLVLPASDRAAAVVGWIVWVIWGLFAVDFAAKFWLAPRKLRFLRNHWLSLLGLIAPTLRMLSFLRLLRSGRALPAVRALSSTTGLKKGGGLFRSRIAYLAGSTSLGIVVLAELAYGFERGPRSTLPSFGAALVWSAASVIGESPTVTPASPGGQVVMIVCLALGVVTISTLAGVVGAYLLHPTAGTDEPGAQS